MTKSMCAVLFVLAGCQSARRGETELPPLPAPPAAWTQRYGDSWRSQVLCNVIFLHNGQRQLGRKLDELAKILSEDPNVPGSPK